MTGEPSQRTPLVAGGDSPIPSQSIMETTDLKGKRSFFYHYEKKDNEGSDDPIQLFVKKTCQKEVEGQPPPFKRFGHPTKDLD